MEEREKIQNKLDARQKLAAMSREELINLSHEASEFDRFISGLADSMNCVFVCYAYRYDDIIRDMIRNNMDRLEEDETLSQNVYKVLNNLNEYANHSPGFKREFSDQYEAIESQSLGLYKLEMSLTDFDKNAADYFRKMMDYRFEDMRSDKKYLATVNYLVKYHSEYMSSCHILPSVQDTLCNVDRGDFSSRKEYHTFKKVANKTMSKFEKNRRILYKEREKIKIKDN